MTLTLPSTQPNQYTASKQLIAGSDFNALTAQLNSNSVGRTAGIGGTQVKAAQMAKATETFSTVTSANDSAKLPKGIPGLEVWVTNADGANSLQVFTYGAGTINGTNGATIGVAQAANANSATLYKCMSTSSAGDVWITK